MGPEENELGPGPRPGTTGLLDVRFDGGEVRRAGPSGAPVLRRARDAGRAADGGRDRAFVDTYPAPACARA